MWFKQYEFHDKQDGLIDEVLPNFLSKPLNEIETNELINFRQKVDKHYVNDENGFIIPDIFAIPKDFEQLLRFSNGGCLIHGERELGYFSLDGIREMYLAYDFLRWDKNLMPIGFDGGGKFYAYEFDKPSDNPPIYAVPASCIGDKEGYCYLGKDLITVMQNPISIDEEINCQRYQPNIEKNLLLERIHVISQKMQQLEKDKLSKAIDLKSYYYEKKQLTSELKDNQQKLAKYYE